MKYNTWKYDDLKKELRKRKLSLSNCYDKNDLIQRLREDDKAKKASNHASSSLMVNSNNSHQSSGVSQRIGASSKVNGPVKSHSTESSSLRNSNTDDSTRRRSLSRSESEFNMWKLEREKEKKEREKIVLWRAPLTTLQYFFMEAVYKLLEVIYEAKKHQKIVKVIIAVTIMCLLLYFINGPHQKYVFIITSFTKVCSWWIFLGILSSVGLGTGLHTFLLYLGPFIAQVTLAAFECGTVNFPSPPYPDEIVCPGISDNSINLETRGNALVLWTILRKVSIESFMWGLGTAIGELPPYFVARFARLSGQDPDDEEFDEVEVLLHERNSMSHNLSVFQRAKLLMYDVAQSMGFFGILLCASIPNPLYDLAGITCGHFLVPFWTFFGATLIGKAVIKVHIQTIFVILMFSKHYVDFFVDLVGKLPKYGSKLQAPFQEFLEKQRQKMHNPIAPAQESQTIIQWLYGKIVVCMILYFAISIINAFAQSYHKRISKTNRESGASSKKC